ncbi:MAG: type II toxin-antitoxin system prevent-host-death family antitoxin [Cyanobacteria bacterium J06621_8]
MDESGELVNIHEAKTQLSKLLSRVALGEEFTIANRGVPIAKLIPYTHDEAKGDRIPGRLRDKIEISDDFNELEEEMIGLFYGDE